VARYLIYAGLAVVLLASGAPGVLAQSRLQGLPGEIRAEVEEVRKACAEYMASFVPADEMQGVKRIRLAGRAAILVDHQSLCNGRRATANCSNRGCDLKIWVREATGAWRLSFNEHAYDRTLRIDRPSGRFRSMSVDLYAGHPWCNPEPGKTYTTGRSCRLTIRYVNGRWQPQRAP